MLLRQIRLITNSKYKFNPYIIFVDCKGGKSYEDDLKELVSNGFYIGEDHFVISERSASMTRNSILSFVDENIEVKLNDVISMDIDIGKTVLSKWYAYRGLMLSSCHNIEDWYPKIIIVPDYYRVIPNQKIKYVYDKNTEFIDKNGTKREWTQKEIAEKVSDIEINVFDGCGIHHPKITEYVKEILDTGNDPTSILWRAPYIKGVTHQIDYESFLLERGVTEIVDVWGVSHDFSEPMIILTESMYKGKKYFQKSKGYDDWLGYWKAFRKYNHTIGVAKWNFSKEQEPVYTRANYQILQDLDLDYDNFALLAKDSIDWLEKIISGDELYTYCFLGLFADKHEALNDYTEAILKNPEMLKEYGVRQYFISLVSKYINESKCGKLWVKSCFKFLAPDLIMLLEHVGKFETIQGCLNNNEFWCAGDYNGEYLIERNPHICKSEHVILKHKNSRMLSEYCGHLENVCMVNGKSIVPQQLNGGDHDGDLVLVVDNQIMKSGVHRDIPIVMDIDDKVTVQDEADTKENKLKIILRTMNSLIGETSNCATGYHNKTPKTLEQKAKYESYVDLLSVINGKAIDFAKTGVVWNIPRNIAKYGKPLPYFMKFSSDYYLRQSKFSRSNSNMNRLCRDITKWENSIRWKRTYSDFNYKIMIDDSLEVEQDIFDSIECIYLDFCKEMKELGILQAKIKNYKKYAEELEGIMSYQESLNFTLDWKYYYDLYRNKCLEVTKDEKALANIAVTLCYEKYPNKNKKFMWRVAGKGIVENIKDCNFELPIRDDCGKYEYLGKIYNMREKYQLND